MIKLKAKTEVIDKGEKFILDQLSVLSNSSVLVGFMGEKAAQRSVDANTVNLATYAYWNEVGVDKIPARPFLSKTMDQKLDLYLRQSATQMRKIYAGSLTADQMMQEQGKKITKWTQTTIRQTRLPPNSPLTVMYKRRMGWGRTPLIATGQMLNSVDYKVKKSLIAANNLKRELNRIEKEMRRF